MPSFNFNATAHQPRYGGGNTLSVGKHVVRITSSEFVPTRDSTATDPRSMLVFTLEALDGSGTIKDRLNLQNPNQQTVNIAYSQLAAYCTVVGKQGITATEELHGIPFMIQVGKQRNNDQYTEVQAVMYADGREIGSSAPAPAPAPQAAPAPAPQPWNGQLPHQQQAAPAAPPAQPPFQPAAPAAPAAPWGAPPTASAPVPAPGSAPPWAR